MLGRLVILTVALVLALSQTPAGAGRRVLQGQELAHARGFFPREAVTIPTPVTSPATSAGTFPGTRPRWCRTCPEPASLITANYIYKRAKPDGTALGVWSPALIFARAMGDKKVKIDPARYEYIGTPTSDSVTCGLMAASGLKSLDDVIKIGPGGHHGRHPAPPGNTTDPLPCS